MVPPSDQPFGQNSQLVAFSEESQNQVIVFWPAHFAIAKSPQNVRSEGEARVSDWAFNESIGPNGLGARKSVQPAFVRSPAVLELRTSGEKSDARSHGGDFTVAVQPFTLPLKPFAVHPVIGVHAGD